MTPPWLLFLAALDAQAAEGPSCDPAGSQMEMNACAAEDFARADAALNAAWRAAIAGAREADRALDRRHDRRPTHEATLRAAQRAWLAFRDAHCAGEGFNEARGGSMEPMIYNGCRARITRERTAQLRPAPVFEQ